MVILFGPMGEAGAGHALAQAAFVQEIAFQAAELAVEQVGGDFDEAHDHIGANRGIGVLDAFFEGLVIRARRTVELAKTHGVTVVGWPFFDSAVAHEITVIFGTRRLRWGACVTSVLRVTAWLWRFHNAHWREHKPGSGHFKAHFGVPLKTG